MRGILGQDLAHQKNFLSTALDRFGDELFRISIAVHFSRVDQGNAEIESQPERRQLVCPLSFLVAHVPGTLAQGRDPFATWKPDRFHQIHTYLDASFFAVSTAWRS
jgi:hypothetical protein